jgi:hypothetical protein
MWACRDRTQERLRTASLMINANLASRMEDATASREPGALVSEAPAVNGAAHA